ncbi:sodium channel protein Nach-like [Cataglyphis hispanica]|uniref:sodium channel protein Nach-like n=1 Tax=Cataglyphis hispanica TaxID=1086592 RepID=UPI0021804DF6|nr:sodium channel protein Nach-like [Cataglyphis hispanica]
MKKIRTQIRHKASYSKVGCWNILKKQAAEFCSNTGLHGYKYISQTQRPKMERIIWVITVLTSLCCALVLMKMAWNYYATHPTLTVIESTHHGIWNYPFPAITVCDINRVSYNLTKEFVKNLRTPSNLSKEFLIREMRLMNELLIPGIFGYDVQKNLTRLQDIIDDNSMSILDVAKLITQNCSTLLSICKWNGIVDQCDTYFKQTLSRDGLCCSFNSYTFPDTIPEKMKRSAACGFETGMTIIINSDPNDYHAALIGAYGIKVMIHHSFNYPNYNAEIQLVRLNSEHFISINPAVMYSKPEVKNLAISTRKCIFTEEADKILYANVKERNLTFARYSYHNCLAECRASIARKKCGCIPYYFPQNSTRVCNLRDIQCLQRHKSFFDTSWPDMDQSNQKLPNKIENIKKGPCGCIPDCSLYQYPIESSFGALDPTVYYSANGFSKYSRNGINIRNHSIIHIFFNDLVGFQYRQSVNYSWRNLFGKIMLV